MKWLLGAIVFFSGLSLSAQILDNTEGKTFGETPYFHEEFVKRNKIKTIKGYYSTKASLDYIHKTKDVYFYQFNTEGQLVTEYKTQYGDTLVSMFEYDDQGRLAILRKSDNAGFHSYHFKYDDQNRITEKEYRRDVSKGGDKAKFVLDKTFIVSVEKFEYINLEGNNYKKIYLNHADKVYKDEFHYFNEFDLLIEQEGRMKMGSGLTKTTYQYDEFGRVSEKKSEKRVMGNYTAKWVYEYDEHNNVLAEHYYKDDKYITEYQIVYQQETMLLKALVTRDVETEFVTILRFSDYTFFE